MGFNVYYISRIIFCIDKLAVTEVTVPVISVPVISYWLYDVPDNSDLSDTSDLSVNTTVSFQSRAFIQYTRRHFSFYQEIPPSLSYLCSVPS